LGPFLNDPCARREAEPVSYLLVLDGVSDTVTVVSDSPKGCVCMLWGQRMRSQKVSSGEAVRAVRLSERSGWP